MNAYEEGDRIVLDVVRGDRLGAPTHLHRFSLDLRRGTVEEIALGGPFVDLPRFDERQTGRPHRYAYLLEFGDVVNGGPTRSALHKHDFTTGRSTVHDFGSARNPGEFVFVPAADSAGEDDGFALGFVHDAGRNLSELVVLDASDFAAPEVARVLLPVRVPTGIHGSWLADA